MIAWWVAWWARRAAPVPAGAPGTAAAWFHNELLKLAKIAKGGKA